MKFTRFSLVRRKLDGPDMLQPLDVSTVAFREACPDPVELIFAKEMATGWIAVIQKGRHGDLYGIRTIAAGNDKVVQAWTIHAINLGLEIVHIEAVNCR